MADHLRTMLVLEALDIATQQPDPEETVNHFEQGSLYTAIDFGKRCEEAGVPP